MQELRIEFFQVISTELKLTGELGISRGTQGKANLTLFFFTLAFEFYPVAFPFNH